MRSRQQHILNTVVEEYIKIGDAVSSRLLYENFDFGISPALIRSELHDLMDQGYLEQPHTSGGRIPTDRGLRFFVDSLIVEPSRTIERETRYADSFLEGSIWNSLDAAVKFFSDRLETLSVGYEPEGAIICKRGLRFLLRRVETEDRAETIKVVDDFEKLDERLADFVRRFREEDLPQVFIGSESPLTTSTQLSFIAEHYRLPSDEELMMVVIGPKRMNYRRNLAVMKTVKNKLQERRSRR